MHKLFNKIMLVVLMGLMALPAAAQQPVKVKFETTLGTVVVQLSDATPKHRDNMVKLVNQGFYDGLLFHRVINNFMVQAGDPNSRGAAPGVMLGDGDPGYTLEAEIHFPELYHKRGALAAAREGDETNPEWRSSGSQFYIVTGKPYTRQRLGAIEIDNGGKIQQHGYDALKRQYADTIAMLQKAGNTAALNKLDEQIYDKSAEQIFEFPSAMKDEYTTQGGAPNLDGMYTVFGQVVEGMDVVDKIQAVPTDGNDRPLDDVKIIKAQVVQ